MMLASILSWREKVVTKKTTKKGSPAPPVSVVYKNRETETPLTPLKGRTLAPGVNPPSNKMKSPCYSPYRGS